LDGIRGFNSALYEARPIVEEIVNNVLHGRKKEKYEFKGDFKANVAFCNLYTYLLMERGLSIGMLMQRNVLDIMLIN
jgi:hypothetical protein